LARVGSDPESGMLGSDPESGMLGSDPEGGCWGQTPRAQPEGSDPFATLDSDSYRLGARHRCLAPVPGTDVSVQRLLLTAVHAPRSARRSADLLTPRGQTPAVSDPSL